jgi:aldehyde dehydrogenase (NAD+)
MEVAEKVDHQAINKEFRELQSAFPAIRKSTASERKEILKKLKAWVLANRELLYNGMYSDFSKPAAEVDLSEVLPITIEIDHTVSNLRSWMKPRSIHTPLMLLGTRSKAYYEPKGTCLIISPWNYPFNLSIGPIVSAIAAGNNVILKPSEMTPGTNEVIKRLVKEVFTPDLVRVIEGDQHVAAELLKLPFDHIFFTGSPSVGKIVMRAAAENLTSVTLELGGKSPLIIDETADLEDAAEKVAFGKFINNGQTCIAPDYLLIHESAKEKFINAMSSRIRKFYGEGEAIKTSPHYARIINKRHHNRLNDLLKDAINRGCILHEGGKVIDQERFISPTIIEENTTDSRLMDEEIFGPILPVVSYKDPEEAVKLINSKPKPLALYIFSKNSSLVKKVLAETSSGGVCINEVAVHFMNPALPFGGVNNSGIGKGHGHAGFLAFSHEKGVLKQRVGFTGVKLLYPPYTDKVKKLINLIFRYL